jgi:hypothetical protein
LKKFKGKPNGVSGAGGISWFVSGSVYRCDPAEPQAPSMTVPTPHDGQTLSEDYTYAPLPKNAVLRAEAAIRSLTFRGEPLLE